MKTRNSTKSKLLSSVIALVLCVSMLIGATFAWFTDTASTGVNKIQAGNLDIALEMNTGTSENPTWVTAEGKTLQFKVDGSIPAEGTQILWEPGCTYELPELRIINNGDLKLKYKIVISGIGGDVGLNNVIDWTMTVKDSVGTAIEKELTADHALEPNAYNILTISGHMQESAGNEYQGMSIDNIAITVAATQLGGNLDSVSGEHDSIGNEYDKDATYPPLATYINNTTSKPVTPTTDGKISGVTVIQDATATSTVPADTKMFSAYTNETENTPVAMENSGSLERGIKTTAATADSVTYDISYNYVNANGASTPVVKFGNIVENIIPVSTGLKEVKVTHSHNGVATPMTMSAAMPTDPIADNTAYYNSADGKLYVWSSKYSSFKVEYKSDFAAATGGQGYATLKEAFDAAKDGALITVLKDITLTGPWTPVANFKGTLDGNEHTISGLYVSGENYVGLIGVLDRGTVKNLKFANVTATGAENVGAVVGRIIDNGKVENVHVLSGTVTGDKRAGGIVGSIKAYGSIVNCSNAATVETTVYNAGGIVGAAYYTVTGQQMYITNCKNTGKVTSAGNCAGGIVGLSAANVSGCTNSAAISGAGTSIGGIVGEQKTYGSVTNNTNSGTVTNSNTGAYGNGGIIGWLRYHGEGETTSYAVSDIITVTGNTNSGNVSGGNDAGGIIGTVYNSADVTGNTNTASSLSATTFAAGIVGNYQTTETPAAPAPASNKLTFGDNTTSTSLDSIQASNKNLEIYTNGNDVIYAYSGSTIPVNPSNIQGFLDGKYGSIDGKTLVLSEGNYGKLELGRATKYAGSNTDYYIGGVSEENKKTYEEFVSIKNSGTWSESAYYVRNMSNVTLKAADGADVSVAGLVASSGHVYGNVYDYVLDKAYTSGSAYFLSQKLENITIEGITFTAKTEFATSSADTVIDGVTFKNCTFNIGSTASGNQALRYYNESNNGNVKNLTVDSCKFNTCYQGVYTQKINGVTVTNCKFDTTAHNAIAVQSGSAVNHKAVVITGNTFENIGDRIIRFGNVGADTQITIQNNTATNSGAKDGQVIKAESLAEGVTYNISGNNWGEGTTVPNTELADRTA